MITCTPSQSTSTFSSPVSSPNQYSTEGTSWPYEPSHRLVMFKGDFQIIMDRHLESHLALPTNRVC